MKPLCKAARLILFPRFSSVATGMCLLLRTFDVWVARLLATLYTSPSSISTCGFKPAEHTRLAWDHKLLRIASNTLAFSETLKNNGFRGEPMPWDMVPTGKRKRVAPVTGFRVKSGCRTLSVREIEPPAGLKIGNLSTFLPPPRWDVMAVMAEMLRCHSHTPLGRFKGMRSACAPSQHACT